MPLVAHGWTRRLDRILNQFCNNPVKGSLLLIPVKEQLNTNRYRLAHKTNT